MATCNSDYRPLPPTNTLITCSLDGVFKLMCFSFRSRYSVTWIERSARNTINSNLRKTRVAIAKVDFISPWDVNVFVFIVRKFNTLTQE